MYSEIINRAAHLTQKHKWLWLYGMVLVAFAGGGSGGFNNISGFMPTDKSGDPGSTRVGIFLFEKIFSNILPATWIILALLVIMIILLGWAIVWVVTKWATAGLIVGMKRADDNESVTLANTAGPALGFVKNLIILGILATLISIVATLAVVLVWILILVILFALKATLFLILFAIAGLVVLAYLYTIFAFTGIYAQRFVVLGGLSPLDAWQKGFATSRKNFRKSFMLAIINAGVSFFVGLLALIVLGVALGIPGVLIATPLFSGQINMLSIVALVVLFITFMELSMGVTGIVNVYKYGAWNLMFGKIKK